MSHNGHRAIAKTVKALLTSPKVRNKFRDSISAAAALVSVTAYTIIPMKKYTISNMVVMLPSVWLLSSVGRIPICLLGLLAGRMQ